MYDTKAAFTCNSVLCSTIEATTRSGLLKGATDYPSAWPCRSSGFIRLIYCVLHAGSWIRAAGKINWPEIAPDSSSDTRRVNGFILVVWGHWCNAVTGPKDKQDGAIYFAIESLVLWVRLVIFGSATKRRQKNSRARIQKNGFAFGSGPGYKVGKNHPALIAFSLSSCVGVAHSDIIFILDAGFWIPGFNSGDSR